MAAQVDKNDALTANNASSNGSKKKTRRRKKQIIVHKPLQPSSDRSSSHLEKPDVTVEYVPDQIEVPDEFKAVFAHFAMDEPKEDGQANGKHAGSDMEQSGSDDDMEMDTDDEKEVVDEETGKMISKKKLKKMQRMSVAQLKQLTDRPEVVEWVDVTAMDPKLLVHLKAYRNTVPIPEHWASKRRYLSSKRGIEKPPFELPAYIKATGVMQARQALREKEEGNLKASMRAKRQGKVGKMNLDYQRLHDAFFRFQTKPVNMSLFGQVYFEGREFETKLKERRPGKLSAELREALGMTDATMPPPWLLNMQRFGPPPSYPSLKIPGLNCPIPEGAMWGYHPGGWGKPPVDAYNRPLYGDVFGVFTQQLKMAENPAEAWVKKQVWGELEELEAPEEVMSDDMTDVSDDEDVKMESEATKEPEPAPQVSGMVTPSGMTSVGYATPETIQLRKEEPPARAQPIREFSLAPPVQQSAKQQPSEPAQPKQLFTVLSEQKSSIAADGLMGSEHTYSVSSSTEAAPTAKKRRFASTAAGSVSAVSLTPEELERLDDKELLEAKYRQQNTARLEGTGVASGSGEDFSDLIAAHNAKQAKKRAAKEKSDDAEKKKKHKEFKF